MSASATTITTTTVSYINNHLNTPPPEKEEEEEIRIHKNDRQNTLSCKTEQLPETDIVDDKIYTTTNNDKQALCDKLDHLTIRTSTATLPATVALNDDTSILSELISTLSSTTMNTEREGEENDLKRKLTTFFFKTVSSGNIENLNAILEYKDIPVIRNMIDEKDEDGNTALIYAACFGKFEIAQALLIAGANIDSQDPRGWTALMWATTNHHEQIVKLLMDYGASAQTRSAKGRTVLDFVKSSSCATKDYSPSSAAVMADIILNSSSRNRDSVSSADTQSSDSSSNRNSIYHLSNTNTTTRSNRSSSILTSFSLRSSSEEDYLFNSESTYTTDRQKMIEEYLLGHNVDGHEDDEDDELNSNQNGIEDEDDELFNPIVEFNWDRCMPDQMFVFAVEDLSYILDTVISRLELPVRSAQDVFLPANVVFLSARFAHYFSSSELLEDLMEGTCLRISTSIKTNTDNIHDLAYWLTNITRLLYYLKKDLGLVVATAEYQLRLSELISETYNYIVQDTNKRISKILEPAMLEHDPLAGMMEEVSFADENWQRFFFKRRKSVTANRRSAEDNGNSLLNMAMQRSITNSSNGARTSISSASDAQQQSTASSASPITSPTSPCSVQSSCSNTMMMRILSPKTITQLLSSTYYVLQSYEVHSTIIVQAIAQFLNSLSCELFNHILSKKKYLCRSKAMQIRMNISVLEEWIRSPTTSITTTTPTQRQSFCHGSNNTPVLFPSNLLLSYLNPSIQLVQLLQCISQLSTLEDFQQSTKSMFDTINDAQLRRIISNYRYELNEPKIPEEIERFVQQNVAEEAQKLKKQKEKAVEKNKKRKSSMIISTTTAPTSATSTTTPVAASAPSPTTTTSASMMRRSLSSRGSEWIGSFFNSSANNGADSTSKEEDDDEETIIMKEEKMNETKDAKFMLPFFVPTTAQLQSFVDYQSLYPMIPESWMPKLDKSTNLTCNTATSTSTTAVNDDNDS